MSDPILAWHFLPKDGKFRYGDNRKPKVGKVYRAKDELLLCENGMHASTSIIDALRYAPGPLLCRVEMIAPIIRGDDKIVARGRKILWKIEATDILHRFAAACAQRAAAEARVAAVVWVAAAVWAARAAMAARAAAAVAVERKWQEQKLLQLITEAKP